jgi:hypothetical protein
MLEVEWMQVLWGSVGTGIKEDESSTGSVWAAGLHHVMARSRLAHVWNLQTTYFFNFQIFFSMDTESVDIGAQLYMTIHTHTHTHTHSCAVFG